MAMPTATELNPVSLPELAYEYLRNAIFTGQLADGEALPQEEIAAKLGISRLPVREALGRLDSEGLVVLRPRRGYVVASLDPAEIDDVLNLQSHLEGLAAHAATKNRSDAVLAQLEKCLARLEEITSRAPVDVQAFAEWNQRFHDTLFESSGRAFLCRMLRLLRANSERYARVAAGARVDVRASQQEHRDIVEAYRKGNAARAAALCRTHREATRKRLVDHLAGAGKR